MGTDHAPVPLNLVELVNWAEGCRCTPLPESLVPGADVSERSRLAALGGLVGALLGHRRRRRQPPEVNTWLRGGPTPPPSLLGALCESLEHRDDVLARAYDALVSPTSRRRLGTFFTPPAVVEHMLERAARLVTAPDQVIDPGAGVGVFTLAARRRWPNAHVVAVDVNVVTLGLLVARCELENAGPIQATLADFLGWLPQQPDAPGTRLIIGNPPYTRHHELTSDQRRSARDAAGGWVGAGLPGLSTFFVAAAYRSLRSDDALVFLLPASWSESRYAQPLVRRIWGDRFRPVNFHWFPPTAAVFPSAVVSAMIVELGPEAATEQPFVARGASVAREGVTLNAGREWTNRQTRVPPRFNASIVSGNRAALPGSVPLGSFARVRRGVATGRNSFFFLRDEDVRDIPSGALRPGVLRLRHVNGDVLTRAQHEQIGEQGERRWLLWLYDDSLLQNQAILMFLERGISQGIPSGHLAGKRRHWYRVEEVAPPDLFLAPMGKGQFRVVRNAIGALPSNAIYGIYLDGQPPGLAEELATWLRTAAGQSALRQVSRRYGDGLYKLEPKAVLSAGVPEPVSLLQPANSD